MHLSMWLHKQQPLKLQLVMFTSLPLNQTTDPNPTNANPQSKSSAFQSFQWFGYSLNFINNICNNTGEIINSSLAMVGQSECTCTRNSIPPCLYGGFWMVGSVECSNSSSRVIILPTEQQEQQEHLPSRPVRKSTRSNSSAQERRIARVNSLFFIHFFDEGLSLNRHAAIVKCGLVTDYHYPQ